MEPAYSQFAYKLQVRLPFPKEKGEFEVRLEQKRKIVNNKKRVGKSTLGQNKQNQSTELLYKYFS